MSNWRHGRMRYVLVGCIGFFVALHVFTLDSLQVRSSDYAGYLLQAECVLQGQIDECKADGERRSQSEVIVGPDVYPWGYPILLALPVAALGFNAIALKLFNLAFFFGALWILYRLLAGWLGVTERLLIVLVLVSSFYVYWAKQSLLSEFPALFFALLSLYLIKRQCAAGRPAYGTSFLTGIVIFCAVFIRTANVMLLPALWIGQFLFRKGSPPGWGGVAYTAISTGVFLFLWVVSSVLLPSSSYGNHFTFTAGEYLSWLSGNLPAQIFVYVTSLGELIGRPMSHVWTVWMWGGPSEALSGWLWFTYVYVLILVGAAVLGAVRCTREVYVPLMMFAGCSLGLLVLYPVNISFRGILVVTPIILFFAYLGLRRIDDRFFPRSPGPVLGAWFAFLHAGICLVMVLTFELVGANRVFLTAEHTARHEVFAVVERSYGPEDVVGFYRPRELQLETGVFSVAVIKWDELGTGSTFDPRDFPDVDGFIVSAAPLYQETVHQKFDGVGVKVFENERYTLFDTRSPTSSDVRSE